MVLLVANDHSPLLIPPLVPVDGINAVTGAGKSLAAIDTVLRILPGRPDGTSIYFSVPTHVLGDEMVDRVADAVKRHLGAVGISVLAYRGLTAPDPEVPGQQMCWIADDADQLRRGGADIRRLCGVDRDGEIVLCPFFHECGWQRQQRLGKADVCVIPHNLLAHPRASFLYPAAALVVDESPIGALLTGLDGPPRSITLYNVALPYCVPFKQGGHVIDDGATADLADAKGRLAAALEEAAVDMPIMTSSIEGYGLSAAKAALARELIYRLKDKIDLTPDMSERKRKEAVDIAKANQRLFMEARLWSLVSNALTESLEIVPGLRVEIEESREKEFKVARMRWREEIHPDWRVPTLLMDATAKWEMFTPFWPRIDRLGTFDAAMPHVTVRQVLWSGSKAKLIGDLNTARRNRARIHHYLEARSVEFRRILVICQCDLELELTARGLPTNIETGHFNGMRGIDKYKDVDCLILVGRPQAPPDQVEMRAEVLFDRVPERGPDWVGSYYPRRNVGLLLRGGRAGPFVEMEYHPDPNAEMVRWSICEAELIQDIGRGRGVNRTSANPLQIDIIGTVPLPIEVDEILSWDDAQANPFDLMVARGIVPDCDPSRKGYWSLIAAILPDCFKDAQAAKDWGRSLTMESANKVYSISKFHREGFVRAEVRLARDRYKVPVLIAPGEFEPKSFAEKRLGNLDFFALTDRPAPKGRKNASSPDEMPVDGATSRVVDIGVPPIIDEPPVPLPVITRLPFVVMSHPEPERAVKRGAIEDGVLETAQAAYRRVIAKVADGDWLDPESRIEAARRWIEEGAPAAGGRSAVDASLSYQHVANSDFASGAAGESDTVPAAVAAAVPKILPPWRRLEAVRP